ncbi:MAG: hypothetical protein AAF789_11330 [Bacteroidota bacterium]
MSAAKKLKEELFNYIHLMDEKSLRVIHAMVGAFVEQQEADFWDQLSDEQKEKIELSRKQHKDGEGIPHESVMKAFREKYRS